MSSTGANASTGRNPNTINVTPGAPTGRSQAIGVEGNINAQANANDQVFLASAKSQPFVQAKTATGSTVYIESGKPVSQEQFNADLLAANEIPTGDSRLGVNKENQFADYTEVSSAIRSRNEGGDTNAILRNQPRVFTEYNISSRGSAQPSKPTFVSELTNGLLSDLGLNSLVNDASKTIEAVTNPIGNFFVKSSEGYNITGERLLQSNNVGIRFLGGLSEEGAGFTSTFASLVGKPVPNLKQNIGVEVGEGAGVGAQLVLGGEIFGGVESVTGISNLGRGGQFLARLSYGSLIGGGQSLLTGSNPVVGATEGGLLFAVTPIAFEGLTKGAISVKNALTDAGVGLRQSDIVSSVRLPRSTLPPTEINLSRPDSGIPTLFNEPEPQFLQPNEQLLNKTPTINLNDVKLLNEPEPQFLASGEKLLDSTPTLNFGRTDIGKVDLLKEPEPQFRQPNEILLDRTTRIHLNSLDTGLPTLSSNPEPRFLESGEKFTTGARKSIDLSETTSGLPELFNNPEPGLEGTKLASNNVEFSDATLERISYNQGYSERTGIAGPKVTEEDIIRDIATEFTFTFEDFAKLNLTEGQIGSPEDFEKALAKIPSLMAEPVDYSDLVGFYDEKSFNVTRTTPIVKDLTSQTERASSSDFFSNIEKENGAQETRSSNQGLVLKLKPKNLLETIDLSATSLAPEPEPDYILESRAYPPGKSPSLILPLGILSTKTPSSLLETTSIEKTVFRNTERFTPIISLNTSTSVIPTFSPSNILTTSTSTSLGISSVPRLDLSNILSNAQPVAQRQTQPQVERVTERLDDLVRTDEFVGLGIDQLFFTGFEPQKKPRQQSLAETLSLGNPKKKGKKQKAEKLTTAFKTENAGVGEFLVFDVPESFYSALQPARGAKSENEYFRAGLRKTPGITSFFGKGIEIEFFPRRRRVA